MLKLTEAHYENYKPKSKDDIKKETLLTWLEDLIEAVKKSDKVLSATFDIGNGHCGSECGYNLDWFSDGSRRIKIDMRLLIN